MKKLLIFALLFTSCFFAIAQKNNGIVRGTLKDSASKHPLNDATVSIISAKDSSLISFSLSSNSGFFEIKNIPSGKYILLVSYQGFGTLKKPFSITETGPVADLSSVLLVQDYKMLGE